MRPTVELRPGARVIDERLKRSQSRAPGVVIVDDHRRRAAKEQNRRHEARSVPKSVVLATGADSTVSSAIPPHRPTRRDDAVRLHLPARSRRAMPSHVLGPAWN
jgi:hypothetical protein